MNTLMLSITGAFSEFERSMILERHGEATAAAKAAGRPTGQPERLKPADIDAIKRAVQEVKVKQR